MYANSSVLIETALALGARAAAVETVDRIAFRREFRAACEQNTCGKYGRCWMCPPDVGDIDEMIARAKRYRFAFVFQSVGVLEDSYDIEGMQAAAKAHNTLTSAITDQIEGAILHHPLKLGAGACHICDRCARIDELPCRNPYRAVPSLESYGIAVSELAAACNMNYINGANTVTYFGAYLFDK